MQGVLRLNRISETILKDAVQEVIIIRPGFFHDEFAHALEEARADPPVFHSWITPVDHKIPMVSFTPSYYCPYPLRLGADHSFTDCR